MRPRNPADNWCREIRVTESRRSRVCVSGGHRRVGYQSETLRRRQSHGIRTIDSVVNTLSRICLGNKRAKDEVPGRAGGARRFPARGRGSGIRAQGRNNCGRKFLRTNQKFQTRKSWGTGPLGMIRTVQGRVWARSGSRPTALRERQRSGLWLTKDADVHRQAKEKKVGLSTSHIVTRPVGGAK